MVPLGSAVRLPPVAWNVALVMPVLHQGEALGTGVGMTERVLVAEGGTDKLPVTVGVRDAVGELLGVDVELAVSVGVMLAEAAAGERVRLTDVETLGLLVRETVRETDTEAVELGDAAAEALAVADGVVDGVADVLIELEGLGLGEGATGEFVPVALSDPVGD